VKNRRPRVGMAVLLVAFIVFAAILGALLLNRYSQKELQPSPATRNQQEPTLPVTLFFAAPDGSGLVREGREIDACEDPADCVAELLAELVNGPLGDLTVTLPPTTVVRSVRIEGELAIVDLGSDFVSGLPEGSHAEMMAVYSIIDTIASNFPFIKKVKLVVEGQPATALPHLDLREPLIPDFSLIK